MEGPGTASRNVYYSHFNADGTLEPWGQTTDLPDVWWDHKMIEHNGSIYVIGGWNSGGVTNRVLRAKTNPDGTVGAWEDMPALPQPARAAGVTRAGDYAFVVGGYSGSDFLNAVYSTAINADGQMASWQTSSNSLPIQHCCGALAEVGGFLYLTGGYSAAEGYTDKVYRSQLLIPLPSPTPTPTPSPTPSPLPALEVIDLKQYSPPWGSLVYDTANAWSTNPTIARWGCALTSAAMVLKYHGHADVDPQTLNSWLVSQADGYIRSGLVNWLAVSRYTRLHDTPDSPTLEYRRLGTNSDILVAELAANRPAILQEPGHFVVAKSQLPDTFGINDPAYADRPTLASYANTYLSLGSFRPTHTDLSYILLVVDSDLTLEVRDPSGNLITGASFTDNPLVDDVDGSLTSGESVNTFLLPTPAEGNYDVKLTGPLGTYTLDSYLYDEQGEVLKSTYLGLISPSEEDRIVLVIGDNPQSSPQVTIDTTIQDLKDAHDQGLIKSRQIYQLLRRDLLRAKDLWARGKVKAAKALLYVASRLITIWSGRFIDPAAAQVLTGDIEILYQSL